MECMNDEANMEMKIQCQWRWSLLGYMVAKDSFSMEVLSWVMGFAAGKRTRKNLLILDFLWSEKPPKGILRVFGTLENPGWSWSIWYGIAYCVLGATSNQGSSKHWWKDNLCIWRRCKCCSELWNLERWMTISCRIKMVDGECSSFWYLLRSYSEYKASS